MSALLKNHYKPPSTAINICRYDKPVATETVYSDTPDIDDVSVYAQLFVGTKLLISDVYGMKIDKQFINTLEDNIRARGAIE